MSTHSGWRRVLGDGGLSLSGRRRDFEVRQRRRWFWWVVGVLVGVAVVVWWGPTVRGAVERAAEGPAADVSELDEFIGAVEDLQERLLSGAVQDAAGVDYSLRQVADLQALVDGTQAGYVEGGADRDLVRVRRVVDSSRERVEQAAKRTGHVGGEPGLGWERCQERAGSSVGTREHATEALRACLEPLDMSESYVLVRSMGDIDHYLSSITGAYNSIYDQSFRVASGAR